MDITIGNVDMVRTSPLHAGTSPLLGAGRNTEGEVSERGSFESFLMDAVSQMNSQQVDVNRIQEQIITDPDSVDIHDVTIAMAKAKMSMNLAQTVIDRVISGWNELSQTR